MACTLVVKLVSDLVFPQVGISQLRNAKKVTKKESDVAGCGSYRKRNSTGMEEYYSARRDASGVIQGHNSLVKREIKDSIRTKLEITLLDASL